MPRADTYRKSQIRDLLCFEINDVMYAINVASIREIINPLPMTRLPQAPAAVLGVAEHRDQIVTVVSLRRRYGMPQLEDARRAKWIVHDHHGKSVALVVDRVVDVFSSKSPEQRAVPNIGSPELLSSVVNAYSFRDVLVFELDLQEIVRPFAALQLNAKGVEDGS